MQGNLYDGFPDRIGFDTVALTNRVHFGETIGRHLQLDADSDRLHSYVAGCFGVRTEGHKRVNGRLSFQLIDEITGLRFAVSEVRTAKNQPQLWARVECSLPKLLHGTNVHPATLEDFRDFCKLLDSVDIPCRLSWTQANVSRLDLVCDTYRWPVRPFIERCATIDPLPRMKNALYRNPENDGLTAFWWNGSHALRVYDKHAESNDPAALGQVRIEYQLRARRLRYVGVHYAHDVTDAMLGRELFPLVAALKKVGDRDDRASADPLSLYWRMIGNGCKQRDAMLIMAAAQLEAAGVPLESRHMREKMKGTT